MLLCVRTYGFLYKLHNLPFYRITLRYIMVICSEQVMRIQRLLKRIIILKIVIVKKTPPRTK